MSDRTDEAFEQALPRLLEERRLSLRALGRSVGVDPGFLSRVLNGQGKRASPELVRRVAKALKLPADYFLEARRGSIVERLEREPDLVNEVFDRLERRTR